MSAADSGWYPDPGDPDSLRWWTGTVWTEFTLPAFALFTSPGMTPKASAAVPVRELVDGSEPALPPLVPDGPIRVAPAAPEKRRRTPAVPRQATPAVPAAAVVEGLPKQVQPEALAAMSSATLVPGPDSPPAQQRSRWRRTK